MKRRKAFTKAIGSKVEVYGYAGDSSAKKLLEINKIETFPTIVELFEEVKRKALEWL